MGGRNLCSSTVVWLSTAKGKMSCLYWWNNTHTHIKHSGNRCLQCQISSIFENLWSRPLKFSRCPFFSSLILLIKLLIASFLKDHFLLNYSFPKHLNEFNYRLGAEAAEWVSEILTYMELTGRKAPTPRWINEQVVDRACLKAGHYCSERDPSVRKQRPVR